MALRDLEADGSSEFPIICESCLGDNPYVRMMKAPGYGKECKICTRPFTVFRWSAGRDARYKKTEICQTCSRLKNVCQVCVLDLEYGLPVQVRDAAAPLGINSIRESHVNREYFAEEHDRSRARGGIDYESSFGKGRANNDTILKLQRTTPYYKRNRAPVCSFYVRGGCKRGAECPYRHEMPPVTGELSQQNIKDRYHGVNDPVALKLLNKATCEMPSLEPRAGCIDHYFNIPPPSPQQEIGFYPSMDPQRMGARVPCQEAALNGRTMGAAALSLSRYGGTTSWALSPALSTTSHDSSATLSAVPSNSTDHHPALPPSSATSQDCS